MTTAGDHPPSLSAAEPRQRGVQPTGREVPRTRRPRRCVTVMAGTGHTDEEAVAPLLELLRELGTETIYLGKEDSAPRIAQVVAAEGADAVELCLAGRGGIPLLRQLLRELIDLGRRDVTIVVQRAELIGSGGPRS